jgi:hypothetical protein
MQRAALDVTSSWSSTKASMALRAAGLDAAEGVRESLDAISTDYRVSRETVRRARNELLHAVQPLIGSTSDAVYRSLSLQPPAEPSADSPGTARALRRVLSMTGPLPWDEVLNAWARAGGRPPYSPLPTDVATMRAWAADAGGFAVTDVDGRGGQVTIDVDQPEQLDQVGQFLLESMRGRPGGVERGVLLDLAKGAGLKPATIATTLSTHPAVMRVGRGLWALRGHDEGSSSVGSVAGPRRTERVRPTSFAWGEDGSLRIELSVPHGPSPVVAVPRAVSQLVEGRDFVAEAGGKPIRIAVRNARLWGFGPAISGMDLPSGARITIALDLLSSTATITSAVGSGEHR